MSHQTLNMKNIVKNIQPGPEKQYFYVKKSLYMGKLEMKATSNTIFIKTSLKKETCACKFWLQIC